MSLPLLRRRARGSSGCGQGWECEALALLWRRREIRLGKIPRPRGYAVESIEPPVAMTSVGELLVPDALLVLGIGAVAGRNVDEFVGEREIVDVV